MEEKTEIKPKIGIVSAHRTSRRIKIYTPLFFLFRKMEALKNYLILFLVSAGYIAFVVWVVYGSGNNPLAWLLYGFSTCSFFIWILSISGHRIAQILEFTVIFGFIFFFLWLSGVPLWLMVILASTIGIFIVIMRRWK